MTYRKFYLTLNNLGYKVNAGVLNAKYFNLPQNRVRVFVVAIRKDTDIRFTYPRGYDSGVRIRHELSDNIPDKYFVKSYEDITPYNRQFLSTHNIMPVGRIKNAKFKQTNEVLSIDGRREVHDAIRKTVNGRGSFDAVLPKIKKFVQSRGNKSYYVRGTFTAKNLDFADDVMFLAEQGFDSISMEPVVTDIEDLMIKPEHLPAIKAEYERLCDMYIQKWKEGKGFNFFHFNVDLEGGPCLAKRVSACGAGNEYFSVVPNGDIYPCHQFAGDPAFKMGSVYGGGPDAGIRQKFASSCLFTRKNCSDCFAKYICSGGCSANNYHFTGDIQTPYAITCEMMKKRTECAMHILAVKKGMA